MIPITQEIYHVSSPVSHFYTEIGSLGAPITAGSINQSRIFRVIQVIKSLHDPLEVGDNLPGINDNVRERGLKQKCF